jgi:hypothetical protein
MEIYNLYQVRGSPLTKQVLDTRLIRNVISTQMNIKNYYKFIDLREYVQNIHGSLEFIM